MPVTVQHQGTAHNFSTLVEAKEFMARVKHAAAKADSKGRVWADESSGVCNRCGGLGRWSGLSTAVCFRCQGTGRAPLAKDQSPTAEAQGFIQRDTERALEDQQVREVALASSLMGPSRLQASHDRAAEMAAQMTAQRPYFTERQQARYEQLMAKLTLTEAQARELAKLEAKIPA